MKIYVGVDVGKIYLDVCISGEHLKVDNNKDGFKLIQKAIEKISKDKSNFILVCEASGGYERDLLSFFNSHGFGTHIAHANKVKAFARSKGYMAKTDKIDCKIIYEYATLMKVTDNEFKLSDSELAIKHLIVRREQLIKQRKTEKNSIDKCSSSFISKSIQKTINFLNKEIQLVENELVKKQKSSQQINNKVKLFSSIPGVGTLTGQYLISFLPELGNLSNKKLSSLVGVAPFCKDSGKHAGKRFIQGGRKRLRNQLYMIAVGCIKNNPMLSKFYRNLREKGKLPKVALVAVIRKLLSIFNSIVRRNYGWENRENLA